MPSLTDGEVAHAIRLLAALEGVAVVVAVTQQRQQQQQQNQQQQEEEKGQVPERGYCDCFGSQCR